MHILPRSVFRPVLFLAVLILAACGEIPSIDKSITSFSFASPAATGLIYEANGLIEVIVPFGTDMHALAPTIVHSGAGIDVASGTARDFSNLVTYTVTATDGSRRTYFVSVTGSLLPVVSTTAVAGHPVLALDIGGVSAAGGGTVSNEGAAPVSERGVCWNATGNPTIDGPHASDGTGTGSFEAAALAALSADTRYYVRSYAVNGYGVAYGDVVSFITGRPFGADVGGGYLFYNDGYGGGLVAAKADQSAAAPWITGGATRTTANGNTSDYFGTGLANTIAIVGQEGHSASAAQICLDYSAGGYDDWYLPSYRELYCICKNLGSRGLGGFSDSPYHSSSESWDTIMSAVTLTEGVTYPREKSTAYPVRAIRSF